MQLKCNNTELRFGNASTSYRNILAVVSVGVTLKQCHRVIRHSCADIKSLFLKSAYFDCRAMNLDFDTPAEY